ncbi:MAG: hypothetical protein LPK45_05105 [Bacteroidota bacterium]|nr:hypothetical protein [Bacteroidota bacterium]MDX5430438.1 hypothetical protein [Bacteroidota bacterium]MDX5469197.1 hypothetical protein [Bacteroidota bacterium]
MLLILVVTLIVQCRKKEPEPIQPIHTDSLPQPATDSGTWNPNDLIPMVWGAEWEYSHTASKREKVVCGSKQTFTKKNSYSQEVVYDCHVLETDYLPKYFDFEPFLHGQMRSSPYQVYRPNTTTCYKGSFTHADIATLNYGYNTLFPDVACSVGPNPGAYGICLDTNAQLDTFSGLFVFVYAKDWQTPQILMGLQKTGGDLENPIQLPDNNHFTISWYKRGVGLVRKDTYYRGQRLDKMVLRRYSHP